VAFRLRARLHKHAGELMERLAADPSAKADSLALHFSMAGDHARAWRYARIAADRAARAYANADAVRLYRLALDAARRLPDVDAVDRVQAWVDCGNAARLAGLFDDALFAYREAYRQVGGDPVGRAELLRLRALARDRAGAFTQALRELTIGGRLLEGSDTPEANRTRARLASLAAMIRIGQERYADALAQALAAAEAAQLAGERQARAQALVAAGLAEMSMGAGGANRLAEALRIYEDLGDLSSAAMVRTNIGNAALIEGRWDDALSWFESARAAELKAGNHVGAACADSNRGEIYAKQGRVAEAEPLLRNAIRVMRASGFHDGAAYAEIQLGRAMVERGALREADELLQRVGEEHAQFGRKSSVLEAALVQSLARIHLGAPAEGLALIDRAVTLAGGAIGWLAPQSAECRARALIALGRFRDAEQQIAAGLAASRKLGLRYEEGTLLRTKALLQRACGQEQDREESRRCAELLNALGVIATPSAPEGER
jgi:tetratricopeptide (TPR) repeat protein